MDLEKLFDERLKGVRVLPDQKESKKIRRVLLLKGGARYLVSIGINRHTAYQILSGRRNLPLSVYLKAVKKLPGKIGLKMAKNLSPKVLLPLSLNAQLAYIAGAMRDGWLICVKDRPIGIGLAQKDRSWLKEVSSLFEANFEIKPKISGERLIIYSEIVALYFHKFLEMPLHGQKDWAMPYEILHSGSKVKKAFVEGFLDAEGHIKTSARDPQIIFYQNNSEVLRSIAEFLSQSGMTCGSIRKDKRSRNCQMAICGRASLLRFAKTFEPRLAKKKKSLSYLRKALS